ncbi:MAG: lytic murein transglycosylase [Pseudomonadales bacterium]
MLGIVSFAHADDDFESCISRLKETALAAQISPAVVDRVLDQVSRSQRVLELDQRQPEFTQTFASYFGARVTDTRVSQGRELLDRHRDLLERVRAQSGVPPQYLLAFWGLETNFGSYLGKTAIPDSLATLACDQRRSRYFTTELISALRIIDSGDISLDQMHGSWAGAMGHVQFMPTTYLKYAIDFDGDGRRDLFTSLEDAFGSAGHFLNRLGWESGLRWGREVRLPADFDYRLAWGTEPRALIEWRRLGITDAFGQRLPVVSVEATLRLPAGHRGPAFLTYRNFDVIMGWNHSVSYALAVGHLADRIVGAGRLQISPPVDDLRFTPADLMEIQLELNRLGYDPGEPDGRLGPATRQAVGQFQADRGLIADGHLDPAVVDLIANSFKDSQRAKAP